MTETGWLAIATPIIAGILAGVGWVMKQLLGAKDQMIKKQEDELVAGRAKINELQDKLLADRTASLDIERKRAETESRVARSIEDLSAKVIALSGEKKP
jgi:hypothetical protein